MRKRITVVLSDQSVRSYDCDDPYAITDPDSGALTVRDGQEILGSFQRGDYIEVRVNPV